MSPKTCLLSIALLCAVVAHAQDVIYKKTGGTIDAKINIIMEDSVFFHRFHDPAGPVFAIASKDVKKIVYQKGTVDSVLHNNGRKVSARHRHFAASGLVQTSNIFSIIPIAYTSEAGATMSDPGLGVSYERFLDHERLSFQIPVLINFVNNADFRAVDPSSLNTNDGKYTSIFVMPGVKVHFGRAQNVVRYALGISVFGDFGSMPANANNNGYDPSSHYRYSIYGILLTNSLNLCISRHMYLAADANVGMPASDGRYASEGANPLFTRMIQMFCRLGYRF